MWLHRFLFCNPQQYRLCPVHEFYATPRSHCVISGRVPKRSRGTADRHVITRGQTNSCVQRLQNILHQADNDEKMSGMLIQGSMARDVESLMKNYKE